MPAQNVDQDIGIQQQHTLAPEPSLGTAAESSRMGLAVRNVRARADDPFTLPEGHELGTGGRSLLTRCGVSKQAQSILLDGNPETRRFRREPPLQVSR